VGSSLFNTACWNEKLLLINKDKGWQQWSVPISSNLELRAWSTSTLISRLHPWMILKGVCWTELSCASQRRALYREPWRSKYFSVRWWDICTHCSALSYWWVLQEINILLVTVFIEAYFYAKSKSKTVLQLGLHFVRSFLMGNFKVLIIIGKNATSVSYRPHNPHFTKYTNWDIYIFPELNHVVTNNEDSKILFKRTLSIREPLVAF
jgi:hypothetical protein